MVSLVDFVYRAFIPRRDIAVHRRPPIASTVETVTAKIDVSIDADVSECVETKVIPVQGEK